MLVTAPLLARELGVDGRGALGAVAGPFLLFLSLGALGVPEALLHWVARSPWRVKRLLGWGFRFAFASGAVCILLLTLLADWFSVQDENIAKWVVLGSFALIPMLSIGVLRGAASGLMRWDLIAREKGLSAAARLVAIIVLSVSDSLTLGTAVIATVYAPILGVLAYVPLRSSMSQGGRAKESRDLSLFARYSLASWLGTVAGVLLLRVDQALLGPLAGLEQVGIYVVAVTVSEVPLFVNAAFRDVSFARASESRNARDLVSAAKTSATVCWVVAGGVLIACPLLVPMFFGEEFNKAVPVCLVLIVAVAVGPAGSVAGAGLAGWGRPGLRSCALGVAAVVNISLLLWLAPIFGAMGAAIAALGGNLVSSNLNIYLFARIADVRMRDFFGMSRAELSRVGAHIRTAWPKSKSGSENDA